MTTVLPLQDVEVFLNPVVRIGKHSEQRYCYEIVFYVSIQSSTAVITGRDKMV